MVGDSCVVLFIEYNKGFICFRIVEIILGEFLLWKNLLRIGCRFVINYL